MSLTSAADLFSLKGKTALVTGASSGIGAHLAKMLAHNGANVVAAARREDKLAAIVESINAGAGGKAVAVSLDVSAGATAIDAAVEKAWGEFGGIDILINNAGVMRMDDAVNIVEGDWELQFNTNVRGVYEVTSSVAKRLIKEGKKGSVINISSGAGNIGGVVSGMTVYSTTKAAVQQLTRNTALELTPKGIRVNSIAPGLFKTEMSEALENLESTKKYLAEDLPARRWGDTDKDLDGAILLLASDAGAYITGINITVDGGFVLALKGFA
eukprot:TRINITY_DN899_c0_g1_i1.p1 TRINITY_DN899_c0_g1~~TRINITY_DN899_c0_g1_i1.p1  ORF type:complete len:270 (+),score=62.28 TRINITY_DN899_c0_g1_i1:317-1126(+)